MREARIILPLRDNAGHGVPLAHDELQMHLCEQFGGYTAQNVRGAWLSPHNAVMQDASVAYDVACEPTPANDAALATLAVAAGRAAHQQAVYLRLPSGEVRVISCEDCAQAAA